MANEYINNYTSTAGKHTGYSSNQFLHIDDYESRGLAVTENDNPQFLYPGKVKPNIYDSPGSANTNNTVQRGFIRGIFPEVLNTFNSKNKTTAAPPPMRRCFFQFNPSLILRSVQASSSTLNPLLQSATELLQPIPGQASFEFQLLFNREREVANQQYRNVSGNIVKTANLDKSLEAYGDTPNYNQNQVGDLGVFADLYVLDSIIGQSITADMVETVKAYWDATKKGRKSKTKDVTSEVTNTDGTKVTTYSDGSTVTVTKDGTTTTTGSTTDSDWADFTGDKEGDFNTRIQAVLGNSAFLSPLPVRIVFSSLFMVEGFVTASNVAFHKFSSEMIPTVCTVTLNVQALYIGFAKQKSYVSEQILQQITDFANEEEENTQIAKEAQELVYNYAHVQLNYLNGTKLAATENPAANSFNGWYNLVKDLDEIKFAGIDKTPGRNIAKSTDGLYFWGDSTLVSAIDGKVHNLQIDRITLNFIDKTLLPKDMDTAKKIKDKAENGVLLEASAADWRRVNEGGTISTSKGWSIAQLSVSGYPTEIDQTKISVKNKPITSTWETGSLPATQVATRPATSYFGTDMYIVLSVSFSYQYPDANGNVVGSGHVTKASVISVAPNSSDFENFHTPGEYGSKKWISV